MDLSCPQCGLSLAMEGPRHEYCPDCMASRGQPVPLVASSLFKLNSRRSEPARSADSLSAKAANVARLMRGEHAF